MNFILLKWIYSIFICLKIGFRKESVHIEIAITFLEILKKNLNLKYFNKQVQTFIVPQNISTNLAWHRTFCKAKTRRRRFFCITRLPYIC